MTDKSTEARIAEIRRCHLHDDWSCVGCFLLAQLEVAGASLAAASIHVDAKVAAQNGRLIDRIAQLEAENETLRCNCRTCCDDKP